MRHEHIDRLHKGLPLRGLRTELTIDPEGYVGEGDLFVFASVLNEFFALYASLNSFHELRVKSTQGGVPMDTTYGHAAPALSGLARYIREYSLYQAVLLVVDRLREDSPWLSQEDLYERLEFEANPSLGFPGSDIDRVQFFHEHGELRARLRLNLVGLVGASSPLPAFMASRRLATATTATPRASSSTCSTTACNA